MHGPPKRLTDDPTCRRAWIAGASIADTPESVSAFAVVLQQRSTGSTVELHERTPSKYEWWGEDGGGNRRGSYEIETRIFTGKPVKARAYDGRTEPLAVEPYPGTILAAEWMALYRLAALTRGPDRTPLVIYTSRREIYAEAGGGTIALGLFAASDALQDSTVFDAWALGRQDARYLLILRRLLLELRAPATRRAIVLLSHCAPHPDIFWTRDNWIPEAVERQVQPSFRWSPQEIAHMLSAVDVSDWGRGTLGQCIDVLLYEDPDVGRALRASVGILLDSGAPDLAVRAATLVLTHAEDQPRELATLRSEFPALDAHEWFADIAASISEADRLSLY